MVFQLTTSERSQNGTLSAEKVTGGLVVGTRTRRLSKLLRNRENCSYATRFEFHRLRIPIAAIQHDQEAAHITTICSKCMSCVRGASASYGSILSTMLLSTGAERLPLPAVATRPAASHACIPKLIHTWLALC